MNRLWTTIVVLAAIIFGGVASSALRPTPLRAQSAQAGWVLPANVGNTSSNPNAVTLSNVPGVGSLNDLVGVPLRFLPQMTNTAGGTTVAVNGLTAKAVLRVSGGSLVAIAGGDFTSGSPGTIAEIVYDGTEFVQTNPATGSEPVGNESDFTGAASQIPAGKLVENGVCISQTTYAALYASYGSTDLYSPGSTGGACSSGYFHVKFANGRASVAADTQGSVTASVLTNAGSGCPATTVAVNCGAQNRTLAQANLGTNWLFPNSGIAASASNPSIAINTVGVFTGGTGINNPASGGTGLPNIISTPTITIYSQGNASSNGSGTPVTTVQPTTTTYKLVKY